MPVEIVYKNNHCEWIDVEGPTEEDLAFLHQHHQINSLMLEDTVDPNHLPKFEQDSDIKFYLLRENTELERQALNNISDVTTKLGIFIIGKSIITVHRMRNRSVYEVKRNIFVLPESELTPDKIALELAQKVLHSFDEEAQNITQSLDNLENEIFLKNTNTTTQIKRLYKIKRKGGLNSRVLAISSEWVNNFKHLKINEAEFTDFQDTYKDVIADFEHLNAQVSNLISMFLALSDQKANQVMKLLAIYSMYFLPISFIAGLYGMNFDHMPELHKPWGYFAALAVMLTIVVATFIYVRRKRW